MRIAVIGAGLMGRAVVYDLAQQKTVSKIGVFDIKLDVAAAVAETYGYGKGTAGRLDASDETAASELMQEYDAAVSCVNYHYNPGLTRAAIRASCHLIDLGGNNDAVRAQLEMNGEAVAADVIVIPDCGLAPGMVAVLAADAVARFDHVNSLKIRVGGLPQSPRPPLNYQMVFSAEGLINEYWEPCVILEDGKKKTVNPMTGLELLEFDGVGKLEAFYTSGGTSTLPDTYEGRIDFLDYKTIRYPGHCQLFRPMLEIGLASRQELDIGDRTVPPRAVFSALLEKNLSFGDLDLVLVRMIAEGRKNDRDKTVVYEIVDRQESKEGFTAMMRTTSFPAAIVAWMAVSGEITQRGCQPQERVVEPGMFIGHLRKRGIKLVVKEY